MKTSQPPAPSKDPAPDMRGPGFVLMWAGAASLIGLTALLLVQFGLLVAGQHRLAWAAQRAALEATLPKATAESIVQAGRRALAAHPRLAAATVTMTRVHGPGGCSTAASARHDEITVSIAINASAVAPDWLRRVGLSLDGLLLQSTANRLCGKAGQAGE